MEKNLALAVAFSFIFLFLWYSFVLQPKYNLQKSTQPIKTKPIQTIKQRLPKSIEKKPEKKYTFKLPYAEATFNSNGALKVWKIKEKNKPLNLIPADSLSLPFQTSEYIFNEPKISSDAIQYESPGKDFTVSKTFLFSKDLYTFSNLVIKFSNKTNHPINIPKFELPLGYPLEVSQNNPVRVLGLEGKKLHKIRKGIKNNKNFKWIGIDNQYFLLALIPKEPFHYKITNEKIVTISCLVENLIIPPEGEKTFSFDFYFGPKIYSKLRKNNLHLEKSIDFGIFGFLGVGMLYSLNGLNTIIKNYGFSIIILTILLHYFMFPLNLKSYKATAKMKELQPKINIIRQKYKNDPKRMNQEMLLLYKTSKTNPFGGCIPMILQIPIFWAFFLTLKNSFELRSAKWILWIKDLSRHDPFYVLPIIMGLTMFLQQKLTTPTLDTTQKTMALIMPVMFTFIFLKFPSGLVLYWITNSIVTLIDQLFLFKKLKVV